MLGGTVLNISPEYFLSQDPFEKIANKSKKEFSKKGFPYLRNLGIDYLLDFFRPPKKKPILPEK